MADQVAYLYVLYFNNSLFILVTLLTAIGLEKVPDEVMIVY